MLCGVTLRSWEPGIEAFSWSFTCLYWRASNWITYWFVRIMRKLTFLRPWAAASTRSATGLELVIMRSIKNSPSLAMYSVLNFYYVSWTSVWLRTTCSFVRRRMWHSFAYEGIAFMRLASPRIASLNGTTDFCSSSVSRLKTLAALCVLSYIKYNLFPL